MESPKFNNTEIQRECKIVSEKIQQMHDRVSEMAVGRKARIISDFNRQPYGTSKKSLKGKIVTVKMTAVDEHDCYIWIGPSISNVFIPIDEVEFLDSES